MTFLRYSLVASCVGIAFAHLPACGGTSNTALFRNEGGASTSAAGGTPATGGSSSGVGGSSAGASNIGAGSGGTWSSGGTGTGGTEETGGTNAGGSDNEGTGGLGGISGSAGDAGTSGSAGAPPQCGVETSETAPYKTKFKFSNQSGKRLFLRRSCSLEYAVTSCTDGYQTALSLTANCTTDCSEVEIGCIACGACVDVAKPVGDGDELHEDWQGLVYTFEIVGNCQCHNTANAPAGRYRITVPVYETDDQINKRQAAWAVTTEFTLPAPGGEVIVPLQKPE